MKTIIAGSRTVLAYSIVAAAIAESGFAADISEVVCGMAAGPDLFGKQWAESQRPPVTVKEFPADWNRLGRHAGMSRNWQMAQYAGTEGALIAVWDGFSAGTRGMIRIARRVGMKVFVKEVRPR